MRTPSMLQRRTMLLTGLVMGASGRKLIAQGLAEEDPWSSLAAQIFPQRPINDNSSLLGIDAPYRAEDAAVVPLSIHNHLKAGDTHQVHSIIVTIDQNPSPIVATFFIGPGSGIRSLSTHVRVHSYSNIHAIAEMEDGSLFAAKRFVKAAGGCSAPAAKQEAESIPRGTMRFRQFSPASDTDHWEAQLMIRHPNYSGMQMDQVSRLYVPANFISSVQVWQGDDLLLRIESGISISENPEFRFDFRPNGAAQFRAQVADSEGRMFEQAWPVTRT